MSKLSESEIARKFRSKIEQGDLADIRVTYHISGGIPSERVDEEYLVSDAEVNVSRQDALISKSVHKYSQKVHSVEVRTIFQKILAGLDSLVPASKARFLPDSLVGSITIAIGEEKLTLYFLAEEEARVAQGRRISHEIIEAIEHLRQIKPRSEEGENIG